MCAKRSCANTHFSETAVVSGQHIRFADRLEEGRQCQKFRLTRGRALITGGASGFGLGIAEALLARGTQVAIGDIDRDRLQAAERSLDSDNLLTVELDVTSPASAAAAVAACEARFGGLDTLVNSAGVIAFNPLTEISESEWDWVLDVDLKGTFLCCQAAAPLLCASGRGRIVNIGSDASKVGFPLLAHYCAAKFGVVGLTKVLAGELAPRQVTVNCVCPGRRIGNRHGAGDTRLEDSGHRHAAAGDPGRHGRRHSPAAQPDGAGYRECRPLLHLRRSRLPDRVKRLTSTAAC